VLDGLLTPLVENNGRNIGSLDLLASRQGQYAMAL